MSYSDEELAALRIPLDDIITATNSFNEENLLKRDEKADVYKGLLLRSGVAIDVAIRKYRSTFTFEFDKEIKIIYSSKHRRNVVTLIGFCDEEDERMIVTEFVANGSFHKYLSDPRTLTCSQILHICHGASVALKQCTFSVGYSHASRFDFKILLDNDWEAKAQVFNTRSDETQNSVVYSFGLILLEVLYGRKVTTSDMNQFVAKVKENLFRLEQLVDDDNMIDPNLRAQMHPYSLSIFSQIAYDCFMEQSFSKIISNLVKASNIQWSHENPSWVKSFDSLRIPFEEIKSATNNFDDTHLINRSSYDKVFKAELLYKGVLPLKKVIIKRHRPWEKLLKDFMAEIKVLISCNHSNLLTLLGFCNENNEMVLVFECDFKNTLDNYLGSGSNEINLTWQQRIRTGLEIAHGLKHLHNMEQNQVITSKCIYLDEKGTAKIANFSLSQFNSYEPWQLKVMGIYSLGVTLFDIMVGRLDYDFYSVESEATEFASMAEQYFEDGDLKKIVDSSIMVETQESNIEDSFDTFIKVAYQCLAKTPSERPTLEVVIKSLKEALNIQVIENLRIPLDVILHATNNFNETHLIGEGGYGKVYKAELSHFDIGSPLVQKMESKCDFSKLSYAVAIKRIASREDAQGKDGFQAELDVLSSCKHPNIVSLLGCCTEGKEMLLVYEHASNGSLDNYLESADKITNLTWTQRMKMCVDIAHGLNYLHTNMKAGTRIIHCDIKSANILLGKNWEAKIADFGLSKFHHTNQQESTINTLNIAGTNVYLDPEYARTYRLKKASDIYSFGVVLFEIFTGTLAYDSNYTWRNERGLAPIARRHVKKGTLKELLDPKVMDEANDELGFIVKVGPDHDSLDTFSSIAFKCIAKTQAERPKIKVVIEELEKALYFQENRMKTLQISLARIKLGVENFSEGNCIMRGGYGMLYKGKFPYSINKHKKVFVKRFSLDRYRDDVMFTWELCFLKELEVLFKYKQENIIGLVGYCKEMEEKIIVYEYASKGSLNKYMNDASLSWTKRLKICVDIANGLKFLHGGDDGKDVVIHKDIKSSNILLTKDWIAKISGFEHALTYPTNEETPYINISDVVGSPGYCDPLYWETHILTKESDIYSFGVVLFEILCGRLACPDDFRDGSQYLDVLVKRHTRVARLDEIVFEGIKERMASQSFATFRRIAFRCLHDEREERPCAGEVVVELQKALELQEAYELRDTELQRNYNEILQFTDSHEIYSKMAKKYIYGILSREILHEDDKLEIIRALQQPTSDMR